MNELDNVINTAKKLINLPYNKFGLDNYLSVLDKEYQIVWQSTEKNQPIKLMSGEKETDGTSGIIRSCFRSTKGRTVYIVGKGILFDSGGYNIKTGELDRMHNDKAGMIIALAVANHFRGNVVAFCPVTTNFLHTSKITPGDVIKIGDKQVEVNDTDAEGRLILAEALSELKVNKDDIVITIATLTGAVGYAIGTFATGVMSPNSKLRDLYSRASVIAKEDSWALPLWEKMEKKYYKDAIIKNYNKEFKAGTTESALFIKQFVKYPDNWIHLDIAYSAFTKDKANGVPIKSLIEFIKLINKS